MKFLLPEIELMTQRRRTEHQGALSTFKVCPECATTISSYALPGDVINLVTSELCLIQHDVKSEEMEHE